MCRGKGIANMAVRFGFPWRNESKFTAQTTEMCGDDVTRARHVRNWYRGPENGPADTQEDDGRPRRPSSRGRMSRPQELQE
jgi:hypothetical protein